MTKLFTDFQDLRMDYIYAEEVWTHQAGRHQCALAERKDW